MSYPYIGITDFTNFEQVVKMSRSMAGKRGQFPHVPHCLHVGVMMSFKTLNDIDTKWAKAFPPKEEISAIFKHGHVYNCLHYADYDGNPVAENLQKALRYGWPGINMLQLDMPWPDPDEVKKGVFRKTGHLEVILQVGARSMEEAGNDPKKVVERLKAYKGIIHRVLLDKSMGKGLGMDAQSLLPYVRAISKEFPMWGITVAGGLGPKTIELVRPIVQEFPYISIDAQGQLRPSGNALDPVDWKRAAEYIRKAMDLFAEVTPK